MGYLLPCMANASNWLYIATTLVSISIHIATEFCASTVFYATDMSFGDKQLMRSKIGVWLFASEPALFALILGFGILLFWALRYGRFVRDSFSAIIQAVLTDIKNEESSWKDEILKTWVVCCVSNLNTG